MSGDYGHGREPAQDWESRVERAIREAQERGEFDNLPGQGKPLRWDDEHVPPEWRMAHRILKNAGFAPSWIEDDKRIRRERKALRELLEGFTAWYRQEVAALAGLPPDEAQARLEQLEVARRNRIATYRQRATKLNEEIDHFNLMVPIVRLQWHRIRIHDEIERIQQHLDGVLQRGSVARRAAVGVPSNRGADACGPAGGGSRSREDSQRTGDKLEQTLPDNEGSPGK